MIKVDKFKKTLSFGEFDEDGVMDLNANTDFRFCVFSDLHYGYANYNVFSCTDGIKKLNAIIDDTQSCDFYLNLGDFADNLLDGTDRPYVELQKALLSRGITMYNGDNEPIAPLKPIYSVAGNHEIAYMPKSILNPYMPIVDGIGNVFAFSKNNVAFLGYDAIFSAKTGTDTASDIIQTLQYTIPDKVLEYVQKQLDAVITSKTESIVAFTHVSCKNISESSRSALFSILTSFNIPVVIFEGHAHRENYQVFTNEKGNKVEVYTLPAVTDYQTYNYYDVTMRNGKVFRINLIEKPLNV